MLYIGKVTPIDIKKGEKHGRCLSRMTYWKSLLHSSLLWLYVSEISQGSQFTKRHSHTFDSNKEGMGKGAVEAPADASTELGAVMAAASGSESLLESSVPDTEAALLPPSALSQVSSLLSTLSA